MKEREWEERARGKEEIGEGKLKEGKEGGEKGDGGIETEKRARGRETGGVKSKLLTPNANCPSIPRSCPFLIWPCPQATPRFYLASVEIKSGSGLGTRLPIPLTCSK